MSAVHQPNKSTVDNVELKAWNTGAEVWWDVDSEARWLHRYNPLRVGYIRDAACKRFQRDPSQPRCLTGLRVLDVGCGGGLVCESLSALGATVVGADPAEDCIEAATRHGQQTGISVDYRCTTAAALGDAGEDFDVVCSLEVIEHVADAELFLDQCAALVKPGGLLVLSTINRTVQSFAFAIVMGEYVLRLLPVGTHQWDRFVKLAEVDAAMHRGGLRVIDVRGVTMNIFNGVMHFTRNTGVNYILTAERADRV